MSEPRLPPEAAKLRAALVAAELLPADADERPIVLELTQHEVAMLFGFLHRAPRAKPALSCEAVDFARRLSDRLFRMLLDGR